MMSAYYKFRADSSGDLRVLVWYQTELVKADWLFTAPSCVLLPVTGVWLAQATGQPIGEGWVLWGTLGYGGATLLWLPAVWLQIRMRDLAREALDKGDTEPLAGFEFARRVWFALGVPALFLSMATLWIMVSRWHP